jgi:hypothetical protein
MPLDPTPPSAPVVVAIGADGVAQAGIVVDDGTGAVADLVPTAVGATTVVVAVAPVASALDRRAELLAAGIPAGCIAVEVELVEGWRPVAGRVRSADAPLAIRLPPTGPSDAERGAAIGRLTEAATLGPAVVRVDAADLRLARRVVAVVDAVAAGSAVSEDGARMAP